MQEDNEILEKTFGMNCVVEYTWDFFFLNL